MTKKIADKMEMYQDAFMRKYPDRSPLGAFVLASHQDCKTYEEYEAAVLAIIRGAEEVVAEGKRSAEVTYDSNRGIRDALLHKLLQMNLNQRIKAVKDDVDSRKDDFKLLSPEELANVLEVPAVIDMVWSEWDFYFYAEIKPLAELLEEHYSPTELLEEICEVIPEQRYDFLFERFSENTAKEKSLIKLLTDEECNLISGGIAQSKLNPNDVYEYRDGTIAIYGVRCKNGESLRFEASLNGDYLGLTGLLTPYDERDGKFMDLQKHPDKYVYVCNSPNEPDEGQDKKEPMKCQKPEIDPICEGCRHREVHAAETCCHVRCGPFRRLCVGEEPNM